MGMERTFCSARSSEGGDHKVSWMPYRVCCRLGPPLLGGDGGEDTGRSGTGGISWGDDSDAKATVPTVWAVGTRKGCWWATGLSDRLSLAELLVGGGEMGFGVVFFERLRGSMAIAGRGEICEAKSR